MYKKVKCEMMIKIASNFQKTTLLSLKMTEGLEIFPSRIALSDKDDVQAYPRQIVRSIFNIGN